MSKPHPQMDWKIIFTHASIAAVVTFFLSLPILGFRLQETETGLSLIERFDWVGQAVIAVFAITVILKSLAGIIHQRETKPLPIWVFCQKSFHKHHTAIGWLLLVFTIVMPFLPFMQRYEIDLATSILIYIMLGWGLNVVVGLTGLLDLGYVAFYAIGAYSYALLSEYAGWTFWECLPVSAGMAVLFALLIGSPVLRLRGDYLAIVTLGFGEIVRIILVNWQSFTHGPTGVSSIPRPSFFGLDFARESTNGQMTFHQFFNLEYATEHRVIFLYYMILLLALLTNFLVVRLRLLPLGRAFEAIKEDEIAARALGINPARIKLAAYAIGAMLAGLAGAFFAARQGFISPESFTFTETALIVAIVVLAGAGSQMGVVLSAIVLVGLPELGRDFADFRMLFFGAVMVLIMLWKPRGLFAFRKPSLLAKGDEA